MFSIQYKKFAERNFFLETILLHIDFEQTISSLLVKKSKFDLEIGMMFLLGHLLMSKHLSIESREYKIEAIDLYTNNDITFCDLKVIIIVLNYVNAKFIIKNNIGKIPIQ